MIPCWRSWPGNTGSPRPRSACASPWTAAWSPLPKSADAGRMRQNLALDFALEAEDLERLRTMPQTGWSGLHPDK